MNLIYLHGVFHATKMLTVHFISLEIDEHVIKLWLTYVCVLLRSKYKCISLYIHQCIIPVHDIDTLILFCQLTCSSI